MAKRLFWLNGIAILAVVINHAIGWGFTALFWWTDRYRGVSVPNFDAMGSPGYVLMVILKQITPFSLPAFVAVSGYFIAFASRGGLTWKMIRTRIGNILIPYTLWSLLVILFDHLLLETQISLLDIPTKLLTGSASPIYYYVPLICQLFLLSPFLVRGVRSSQWKKLLLGMGILQVVTVGWSYLVLFRILPWKPEWFFGNLGFIFTLSIALNLRGEEILPWLKAHRKIWLGLLIVSLPLAIGETEWFYQTYGIDWRGGVETLFATVFTLSFLLTFITYDFSLPQSTVLYKLGQRAFGIYLMHPLVLEIAAKLVYHLAPVLLGIQWVFLPLLITTGIVVPWFAMKFMSETPLRKGYAYIFG